MSRSRLRGSIEIKDSADSGNSFLQEAKSNMIDNGMLAAVALLRPRESKCIDHVPWSLSELDEEVHRPNDAGVFKVHPRKIAFLQVPFLTHSGIYCALNIVESFAFLANRRNMLHVATRKLHVSRDYCTSESLQLLRCTSRCSSSSLL